MKRAIFGAMLGAFATAWIFGNLPIPVEHFLNMKLCQAVSATCEITGAHETPVALATPVTPSQAYANVLRDPALPVPLEAPQHVCPKADIGAHQTSPREDLPLRTNDTLEVRRGIIHTSLYDASLQARVPDTIIMTMVGMLKNDVDFHKDIRPGDEFEVVFESPSDSADQNRKRQEIYFASLFFKDRLLTYYRFQTPGDGRIDYYDKSGRTTARMFLRRPVAGARLSSMFGDRKHPVLGTVQDHTGVDLAARPGSKVMAAASGTVTRAEPYGSYGEYIRLHHREGYKTAYAHLSHFSDDIRPGVKVSQGQTIGYVGSTGRSTGPHLHYEVLRNDKFVDPMDANLPASRLLLGEDLVLFQAEMARIDSVRTGGHEEPGISALSRPERLTMAALTRP